MTLSSHQPGEATEGEAVLAADPEQIISGASPGHLSVGDRLRARSAAIDGRLRWASAGRGRSRAACDLRQSAGEPAVGGSL
jgi:hypothetical protein